MSYGADVTVGNKVGLNTVIIPVNPLQEISSANPNFRAYVTERGDYIFLRYGMLVAVITREGEKACHSKLDERGMYEVTVLAAQRNPALPKELPEWDEMDTVRFTAFCLGLRKNNLEFAMSQVDKLYTHESKTVAHIKAKVNGNG